MIPERLRKDMVKQHYKVVGNHSAVKLCRWTKKSLRDEGICYKERFYGIQSHRCLQMTASIPCCNLCLYCWRTYPKSILPHWNELEFKNWDEPKDIIEGAIKAQRLLLNGFPGWEGTNMGKWKEAQNPQSVALSLTGENLLYPKISELIGGFRKRKIIIFLVTNGQIPERLENITEPNQLYISLDAPDKKTYKELDRPLFRDFWGRLNRSLEIMNSFSCRKVIRLTMVKGRNMENPKGYSKLIEKASPDFLEVKGYVHVGESQKRLPRDSMPYHKDVVEFAKKLERESGYRIKDEQKVSRVILLGR